MRYGVLGMQNIIGSWVSSLQYSPGTPALERLSFFDSGIGFLEIINCGLCSIEKFVWICEDKTLEIETEWAAYNDGQDNFEKEETFIFGSRRIDYKIEVGHSPVYGTMDFLSFNNFCINHQWKFGKANRTFRTFDLECLKEFGLS